MLTTGKVAEAFEIQREPDRTRERYGRHLFGQSLLLARRLVQAGVPVVQANMGRVQNWDSHGNIFARLKNDLLPPLDQGVAALLDDLESLGMLDETLVLVTGEFGRTPKIGHDGASGNGKPGRDHWPRKPFSGVFAGAGARGGQVIGKTDKIGAYPTTPPFTPDDVGATVYHALGVDAEADIPDQFGRPVRLNRGRPIEALYTASNNWAGIALRYATFARSSLRAPIAAPVEEPRRAAPKARLQPPPTHPHPPPPPTPPTPPPTHPTPPPPPPPPHTPPQPLLPPPPPPPPPPHPTPQHPTNPPPPHTPPP